MVLMCSLKGYSQQEESSNLTSTNEIESTVSKKDLDQYSDKNNRIWGRTKFIDIRYAWNTMKRDGYSDGSLKGGQGVSLDIGKTYLLNKKPLLGMLKFGIDAVWMDMSGFVYDTSDVFDGEEGNTTTKFDLGIGVGPSINLAPFSHFDNALKDLKFQLYVHFTPSFSALFFNREKYDEKKTYFAFSPFINFGGVITWKMIGLGLEGRWCKAHYSSMDDGSYNFKSETGRVIIRFCF